MLKRSIILIISLLLITIAVLYILKPKQRLTPSVISGFQEHRKEFKEKLKKKKEITKKQNENEKQKSNTSKEQNEYHKALSLCKKFSPNEKTFVNICNNIQKKNNRDKFNEFGIQHKSELIRIRKYVKDYSYDLFMDFTFFIPNIDTSEESFMAFSKKFDEIYPLMAMNLILEEINSDKDVSEIDPYIIVDQIESFSRRVSDKISFGSLKSLAK